MTGKVTRTSLSSVSCHLKVAPYSRMRAEDGSLSNLQAHKGNRQCFSNFMTTRKAKLSVDFLAFLLVKFGKIWQTANKYFTLVGALVFVTLNLS